LDEDTCAANLMARDAVAAALVPREPITPLTARVGCVCACSRGFLEG
jgi:predicted ABC-class ATPase